jgi:GNAT superfamily N-acetyltransferase
MSGMTSADIRITRDDSAAGQRTAASIWARATAERDNLAAPASIEEKLPGIQHRLSADAGSLHIAYCDGNAAGFAILVTRAAVLELVYLAVVPEAWGSGIGRGLLAYVDDQARATGAGSLELWVIDDNERALRVYERSGWVRTEDLKTQIATGRRERRLEKVLSRILD